MNNLYTFSLNPSEYQPSGSNNLSRINNKIFLSKRFENKINRFLPTIIMINIENSNEYYMINNNKNGGLFKFSENKNIINNCYRFFNINNENEDLNKLTLLCINYM